MCATYACVGHWKRPACPIASRACHFATRDAEHFAHQPFGQVPWLTDGDISIFESGAILLHLGERSDALMPADPRSRSEALEWLFAALNSVEMASLPWSILMFSGDTGETPDGSVWMSSSRLGSSTWSRCWQDANGWPAVAAHHHEVDLEPLGLLNERSRDVVCAVADAYFMHKRDGSALPREPNLGRI